MMALPYVSDVLFEYSIEGTTSPVSFVGVSQAEPVFSGHQPPMRVSVVISGGYGTNRLAASPSAIRDGQ